MLLDERGLFVRILRSRSWPREGSRAPTAAERLIERDQSVGLIDAKLDKPEVGGQQCTLCVQFLDIAAVTSPVAIKCVPERISNGGALCFGNQSLAAQAINIGQRVLNFPERGERGLPI